MSTETQEALAESLSDAFAESAAEAKVALDALAKTDLGIEAKEPDKPYRVSLTLRDVKQSRRVGYIPEEYRQFLVKIPEPGYAPPFWIDSVGSARSIMTPVPMCPPVEPGSKILAMGAGEARVTMVTGMHVDEEGFSWAESMFGSIPLRSKSWLALTDDAPLTEAPSAKARKRLTDEESKALEEELETWSRFLGFRAEKYQWCGTFENILQDVGVEPHRPGYKEVKLSFRVPIEDEALVKALKEKFGDALDENHLTVKVKHTITNVDRPDYDRHAFQKYLKKDGYETVSDLTVLSREPMKEEDL